MSALGDLGWEAYPAEGVSIPYFTVTSLPPECRPVYYVLLDATTGSHTETELSLVVMDR